ncbi:Ubiquitin carboxyl-terminal hydrolase [Gracilaria domingensis]|nr:Ubiquitin carboxyl-terminal hydrolase [Gracilaria domingensis]
MLALVDLQQQRILRQATLSGGTGVTAAVWAAPQGASSLAIFSTSTGRISLCDPSYMGEVNAIAAFSGATTSIATSGYYLAATGLGTREEVHYLEQTVKLYDIRAVQSPLHSVFFCASLMFIAFDQATSQLYNIDDSVKVNSSSEPVWNAPVNPEPPTPSIYIDDFIDLEIGATIPKCALPELSISQKNSVPNQPQHRIRGELYARRVSKGTDITHDLYPRKPFSRFPLQISDELLDVAPQHTYVSYAQAPASIVRNSESGYKRPPKVRPANGKYRLKGERRSSLPTGTLSGNANKIDLSKPAERSKYVEMDLVAWESIEGFDFLKYNTSSCFCGLENVLPNVYVNHAARALYFCIPVRTAIGNHSCHRDWCISCELSFLFHMFDLGGAGMACEAGNFTRAFMAIANAGALGGSDGAHVLLLSQRIENFTRYFLEQLHKDEGVDIDSTVLSVFGAETRSHGTFMASNTDWERIAKPFQHSLIDKVPRNSSFASC